MSRIELKTACKQLKIEPTKITKNCTSYVFKGKTIATSFQHDHHTSLIKLALVVSANLDDVKYVVISLRDSMPVITLFDHSHATAFAFAESQYAEGLKVCVYANKPSEVENIPVLGPVNCFMSPVQELKIRQLLSGLCSFKVV
jgi:hypothetical protein